MPGPGGPGTAAQRTMLAIAHPQLDPSLLQEQVLITQFPDSGPEVFIVYVNLDDFTIDFGEASVQDDNSVVRGSSRTIALSSIGSIRSSDNQIDIVSKNKKVLASMHFEKAEDHQHWAKGLTALINLEGTVAAAVADDSEVDGDDLILLQAKSRQLQSKISEMEAINERRDKQLSKMSRRLDGATQMLAAVQDMCKQQAEVVQAQKVAIVSLQRDLGISSNDGPFSQQASPMAASTGSSSANRKSPQAQQTRRPAESESSGSPSGPAGELEALQGIQALLSAIGGSGEGSAEEFMNLLGGPEGLAALLGEDGARAVLGDDSRAATQVQEVDEEEGEDESDEDGDQDTDEAAALERLRGLEAQKAHFESMLQDSQAEHKDLLEKLAGMKSLMAQMGLDPEVDDDDTN